MAGLSEWIKAFKRAVDNPWEVDYNPDHPECPMCGSTMDFHGHDDSGDFAYGEGYWQCNNCGFKVTEDDL